LYAVVFADLACYSALIGLSSGTNSLLFFFYLFAIIVASSRGGSRFGLVVTALSLLSCLSIVLFAFPDDPAELRRYWLRFFVIGSFGYILSYWGGAELALKKKLALLKDLSVVANPRFGVDWTIELILRRLLKFWDAESCLLLLANDTG